ncbi:WxL domain-containing protein [Enterococcus sp. LJL99]
MKNCKIMLLFTLSIFLILVVNSQLVYAENAKSGDAVIDLKRYKEMESIIRDPEHPENEVDPGETPQTKGDLRFDFVPNLNFDTVKMTKDSAKFSVNAQLFHDNTTARGNFIQISDYRDNAAGWTLQVRQENQFKNKDRLGVELKGAVISLDQAWTNSIYDKSLAPNVSKEVIRMNNIGDTYSLAQANENQGFGTWSVIFGASSENVNDRSNSLSQRKNEFGKELIDPIFKKPVMMNDAISLSVPKGAVTEAGSYSTVLTWILAELP